jgi:hypothetical protein
MYCYTTVVLSIYVVRLSSTIYVLLYYYRSTILLLLSIYGCLSDKAMVQKYEETNFFREFNTYISNFRTDINNQPKYRTDTHVLCIVYYL